MPLSKVLEWMMEFTASRISALSSITAGTFPAPTPTAGFPLEYAARTIPGPPVASVKSHSFISRSVISRLGTSIHEMIFAGAPAATAASSTILAAAMVDFLARGCGEMIMPLRVLSEIRVLNIAVEVGLVVGITAAITPIGSA